MIDALQAWLPDPSQPLSLLIAGLAAAVAILLVGGALSMVARGSGDLVTEGAMPVPPSVGRGPLSLPGWQASAVDDPGHGADRRGAPVAPASMKTPKRDPLLEDAPPGCVKTETTLPIPYGRDWTRAMSVVLDACRGCRGVLEHPGPEVRIASLGDSAMELAARVWYGRSYSGSANDELRRAIADELGRAGFDVPLDDISTI